MTLVGRWVIDVSDRHTLEKFGDVVLEFGENGSLIYTIKSDSKKQIMLMRYVVDGNILVTDQSSAPRIERTVFSLMDNGLLALTFDDEPSIFRRQLED